MLSRFFPSLKKPDSILLQNKELFADFDMQQPLAEYEYVVWDTELTGLNKRKDEIISIGAIRISELQIDLNHTFHSLIRPVNIDANQATLVHRITPEQLKKASLLEHVLPQFIEFCGQAVLIGHFVNLDLFFLGQATKQEFSGTVANPFLDTMILSKAFRELQSRKYKRCFNSSTSLVLDDLTTEFNLPRFKPHDALEDALQTAYLFLYLVKKLQEYGVYTLQDITRLDKLCIEDPLF